MKRISFSLLAGAAVVWLFWAGGFDFDHRGEAAFWASLMPLIAAMFVYSYPWD